MAEHKDMEGVDANLETSLKEYGIAWKTAEDDEKDYLFYYGISSNEQGEYTRFDHSHLAKNADIYKEWNFVEWGRVYSFTGCTKEEYDKMPLPQVVFDLILYYGYENIFGTSYYEGLTYEEIMEKNS